MSCPVKVLARFASAAALAGWATLSASPASAQSSTEMVAGSNDVTTTAATLGPVTVTLQNNSNNPTGTTFEAIAAPTPTASLTISPPPAPNAQYWTGANVATNGVYVGGPLWGAPRFALMDDIAVGSNGMFTSLPAGSGVSAGTGISINTNRAWFLEARTDGLRAANAPQSGQRLYFANAVINLSVPMSNVVLHVVGIGSSIGGKEFTVEMDLVPGGGATGLAQPRLSGTTNFAVSGNQINNTATTHGTSCSAAAAACGSVQVTGTAITQIALRLYIRSTDAGVAWPTGGYDGFMIGLSGEAADMIPTLALPPLLWGETYRGLTATCTNAGPNTVRNPTCAVAMSGAGTITTPVCGIAPGNALAVNASVACTFDYTAPLYNPNSPTPASVTFTATTGALNDRNGGVTAGGNNQWISPGSTNVSGTPVTPSAPAGICSAVANRLSFSFSGIPGGNETGSYDLISHSPFSYDVTGKPVFMTASGSLTLETLATTPGVLFKPTELTTVALPTTAVTGTGEIVIISSRVVGRPGSAMSVRVSDDGQDDHDVFTIETAAGSMLARTPASGSNSSNGDFTLSFAMPADGFVYLRQYIADYGGSYGQRLDGGCLRSNLVTIKSRTSAASIEVGQTATFTITVTNNGPSNASNVQLTDLMPATLSGVIAAASTGSYNPTTGLWSLSSLGNGGSATLTLTGTATTAASNTTVTNTTTAAAGDQTDPTTASDVLSASVTVLQAAQVTATKTVVLLSNQPADCASRSSTPDAGVEAFIPGSCVEYVIGLTNPTGAAARDIRMTDVLTTSLTFMGAAATGFDISDPAYALTAPAAGTARGGAACTVRLDKARLAANTTGQVRIRAVLR